MTTKTKTLVLQVGVLAWLLFFVGGAIAHAYMDAPRKAVEEVTAEIARSQAAWKAEEPRRKAEQAEQARMAALHEIEERAREVKADLERQDYCQRLPPWRSQAVRFDRLARWELLRHNYAMATVWQRRADELRANGAACE